MHLPNAVSALFATALLSTTCAAQDLEPIGIEGRYKVIFNTPAAPNCGELPDEVFELRKTADGWEAHVNSEPLPCENLTVDEGVDGGAVIETSGCIEGGIALSATNWVYPESAEGVRLGRRHIVSPPADGWPGCEGTYVFNAKRLEPEASAYAGFQSNAGAWDRHQLAWPQCTQDAANAKPYWYAQCPGNVQHRIRGASQADPGYPNQYVYTVDSAPSCPPGGCQVDPWTPVKRWRCKNYVSEQPCVSIAL